MGMKMIMLNGDYDNILMVIMKMIMFMIMKMKIVRMIKNVNDDDDKNGLHDYDQNDYDDNLKNAGNDKDAFHDKNVINDDSIRPR